MSEDVRDRVVQILRRVLGPDVNLNQMRLNLESLKMLEVVVALENEFGISIPEDAPLGRITRSADDIVAYLKKIPTLRRTI
ncbi:MAG TPA: acyl carrier protein [Verrucomicrobiae bacterium]|nr:acyl carrier protein [Verrucomicrobiae bacterium]